MRRDSDNSKVRHAVDLLIVVVLGYLIGSVPFAYVVGKGFYRTDVREYGSGNLGGSNTGRVLGKKAGVTVMALDLLKVTLSVFLALKISTHPWSAACGALSAAIGHCFPIYAHFRGGKAVAALYGFLFGLWVCSGYSALIFFIPLIFYLTVLTATRIVSLSGILSSVSAVACACLLKAHPSVIFSAILFSFLIIVRHHENIGRILSGTERKIHWM